MKKNKKLYVQRFIPYSQQKKLYRITMLKNTGIAAVVCLIMIFGTVYATKSLPKDFHKNILKASAETKKEKTEKKETAFVFPKPSEDARKKAMRLKEIIEEDWNEHHYTPTDGEMDNVYVYDNQKICYLTFDDGPSSVTPQILDVLNQYKVKATFFVTGQQASAKPEIIKEIHNSGHTIGNHSYSHVYDSVYASAESFKNEVTNCQNAINKALGFEYKNLVFRFPGGYTSLTNEETKTNYREILKSIGYKYIDWSCLTGDSNTTEPTAEYLMSTLSYSIGNTKTGDIVVLMHDSPSKQITADSLPQIIEYLYSQGYKFETLKNE